MSTKKKKRTPRSTKEPRAGAGQIVAAQPEGGDPDRVSQVAPSLATASLGTGVPQAVARQYPTTAASASLFDIALGGAPGTMVPAGVRAQWKTADDGRAVLHLSGGDAAAPSGGRTGGFSVQVPDSLEAAASGRRVRVTVLARGERGRAQFSLCYSTNDVGNSGWRRFHVGPDFEAMSFEWKVPVMNKGNGDFVGILPAPSPASAVDIAELKVEVLATE